MPSAITQGAALPSSSASFRSHWASALQGDRMVWAAIGANYWLPVYVWLRASGEVGNLAARRTVAFFAWVETVAPPMENDAEFVRVSDFLATRLVSFVAANFPEVESPRPLSVDGALGERRFSSLVGHDPNEAFNRRWALSVLENTLASLRREYELEGAGALFNHLVPFLSFNTSTSQARYAAASSATGLSVSALTVAVFRFRQRYRERLRSQIADTVSAPEEADSELTRLLVAGS